MSTITVKNIPEDLYEKLKKRAKENRRSINNEIIMCIERSVKSRRIDPEEFLKDVKKLQASLNLPPLTDAFLKRAKEEDRP